MMYDVETEQVAEASGVTEPVSLQEAKDWLQIDYDDFDALITSMITGARQSIEQFIGFALVSKSVSLVVSVFGSCQQLVTLPGAIEVSDEAIGSLDSSDALTAITNGEDYFLRGNTLRISPGRYSISFTAQMGTVPEALKEAIKMEVAERWLHRGENGDTTGLSEGAEAKAQPYQIRWL